jgi:L-lactate dehydrogenase complex protein LldF
MSGTALDPKTAPKFQVAAKALMGDSQLRKNVRHATKVIQTKRAKVVAEMPDWQDLRESGKQIRQHTMRHLDYYLEQFEKNCALGEGCRGCAAHRCRAGEGERSERSVAD